MKEDHVTKEYLDKKFDEKLDPINNKIDSLGQRVDSLTYELNKQGVMQEQMMDKIQVIAEMLAPNLERVSEQDERITANEEFLSQHDMQIKTLLQK